MLSPGGGRDRPGGAGRNAAGFNESCQRAGGVLGAHWRVQREMIGGGLPAFRFRKGQDRLDACALNVAPHAAAFVRADLVALLRGISLTLEVEAPSKTVASEAPAEAPMRTKAAENTKPAKATVPAKRAARTAPAAVTPPTPRELTKQATMLTMLRYKAGATIVEIVAENGLQAYTVRGSLAGALKKKLGLSIVSAKVAGRGRGYRIE